jgi:aspartyl-tRNA(Asn)/glutamyl-tRNA(Gln) amidotransferase subunit C
MSVSMEDVERVAELANLDLAAEEKPRMQRDLNAILEYVVQLNEIDTASVEPLAQVSELLDAGVTRDGGDGAVLRPDVQRPCLDRTRVMEEAPETDGTFFKVPKVIER